MRYNPFQPNKMIAPGMFAGRLEEIDTIVRSLFQAQNSNPSHFLIEGERGIGKSSLLFLVSRIAEGRVPSGLGENMQFLTLESDLGGVLTQVDIARASARRLKSKMAEKETLIEKAKEVWHFVQKWEAFGVRYRSEAQNNIEDILDELVDTIQKTANTLSENVSGIFIIIDEADAPPESAGLGESVKLFTERLTRRECNNVLLGLSGLPSLIGKLKASHESSARIFEILHLDPLEPEERRQVVERGLEESKHKNTEVTIIEDDAMQFLCELSEGYPHFIQQFAFSAFAEDTDNNISLEDVINGAYKDNGAPAQLGKKYFSEMYYERVSSPDYRKVLDAMSEHEDNWVVRKTLVKESGVKETTLNNALL